MEHVVESCSDVSGRLLIVLRIFRKLSLKTFSAQQSKNCAIAAEPCMTEFVTVVVTAKRPLAVFGLSRSRCGTIDWFNACAGFSVV